MDTGRCAGIYAERPTEWIAMSNPDAGKQGFYNYVCMYVCMYTIMQYLCIVHVYMFTCKFIHTYALCGYTRQPAQWHLSSCGCSHQPYHLHGENKSSFTHFCCLLRVQLQSLMDFAQVSPGTEQCEEYGLTEEQLQDQLFR